MKQYITLFLVFIILITGTLNQTKAIKIIINNDSVQTFELQKNIKTERIFSFFAELMPDTPETYKYIKLNITGFAGNSTLEDSLQKLVYHNKIKNVKARLTPTSTMKAYYFYQLAHLILGTDVSEIDKNLLLKRNVNSEDLNLLKSTYLQKKYEEELEAKKTFKQNEILNDVYSTLRNDYYNKGEITYDDLVYSAIEGMAKGAKDKHTVYFPPVKNKAFDESLSGNFEGIGAYVELKAPGEFIITSPISGGPAEKAGIKGGDQVLKVDKNKVTKEKSATEIVSWIKGKAGTTVELTILRGNEELKIEVVREKIHINAIDYKAIDSNTYYINIKSFSQNVSREFVEALKKVKESSTINKIIFDLRNDGGGYLDEVTDMLSHLIPKGEPTTVVKYLGGEKVYTSRGVGTLNLNKYKVIILVNSGTASASEIFTGTLKDYFPVTIMGEKTYGKGSVQTIKEYTDGSSLKYTIAKWFTGKTQTGIDEIGITPDVTIELDTEKLKEGIDNQLDKALLE